MFNIRWEDMPNRFIYAAVDSDGKVYAYTNKPTYSPEYGLWKTEGETHRLATIEPFHGDPTQSLIFRHHKPDLLTLTDQELLNSPSSEEATFEMVRRLFQHYVNSTTPIKF